MSVVHLLNGVKVDGQQFTVGGNTYPMNWLSYASNSEQDILGIVRLTEVYPSLSGNQKYDGGYTDDLTAHTRTYTVVAMSSTEIATASYTTMQTNLMTGTPIPDTFIASAAIWHSKQPAGSYLTSISGQDYTTLSNKPTLATVATSGSYADLSSKPTIPAAQVNSDWSAVSGVSQVLNKPSLSTVATSGSYTDLSNKPSIPAAQVQSDWNASSGLGVILNKPSISGTNTGDQTTISGNAGSATVLQTARSINGISFNGSADITVTAAAGTLTGTTLSSGVTASSLTSFGASIALGTPSSGTLTNCTGYTAANLPTITLTGNVTGGASGGSIATTIASGVVTNAMLAGSIDLTTKVTGVLPFANGGLGGSAATSATTGTMTVSMTTGIIIITPTGACTFNGSGGVVGQLCTFVITTSGTSSFTLTWGTNFKVTGTLATGTTTAKMFAVTFRCYATNLWIETGRTIAM